MGLVFFRGNKLKEDGRSDGREIVFHQFLHPCPYDLQGPGTQGENPSGTVDQVKLVQPLDSLIDLGVRSRRNLSKSFTKLFL